MAQGLAPVVCLISQHDPAEKPLLTQKKSFFQGFKKNEKLNLQANRALEKQSSACSLPHLSYKWNFLLLPSFRKCLAISLPLEKQHLAMHNFPGQEVTRLVFSLWPHPLHATSQRSPLYLGMLQPKSSSKGKKGQEGHLHLTPEDVGPPYPLYTTTPGFSKIPSTLAHTVDKPFLHIPHPLLRAEASTLKWGDYFLSSAFLLSPVFPNAHSPRVLHTAGRRVPHPSGNPFKQ